MLKIAFPARQNNIDDHFGHCESFMIMTVDPTNKVILDRQSIASPAGCGCKSNIAQTLSEHGVKIMLAGNMGDGAVQVLSQAGIDVIRGCSGDISLVANQWLDGTLSDSGDACHQHDHACSHSE